MIKGIFSDQTSTFLLPEEPKFGEPVKIKLRIPKFLGKSSSDIYLTPEKNPNNYKNEKMQFSYETKDFYYFEKTFEMPNRVIKYHFEIVLEEKNQKLKYDAMGIVEHRHIHDFFLIPDFKTPNWAHGTIYYQIFVDRFFNGDTKNDPVSTEYIYDGTPVEKKEWNKLPEDSNGHREFYGGDLKGVIQKLDYLEKLGVETLYFNPIFVSPSPHKYDTQDYEHIDPHYGVIEEDTDDLSQKYKVRTTSETNLKKSDELFLELVKKIHSKNMRIILDGVFNHCGSFSKWVDEYKIYEKGILSDEKSPYKDYFYWHGEKDYEGWWGYKTLPKLNYSSIRLWKQIGEIAQKWSGEPYKIDGWRLDVADDLGKSFEENHTFWRYFSKLVKKANEDSIIFAEIYKSPLPWLERKSWDSIMNYLGCMDPISYFLTGTEKHNDAFREDLFMNSSYFVSAVNWALSQLPMNSKHIALNQLSNHDHSRWMTRTTKNIGRSSFLGHELADKNKDIDIFKMGLIMMFTLPGSPGLYYGDEIGLTGFTDPDNRRTMPWDNFSEENKEILNFTKKLIKIYKENPVLKKSSFTFLKNEGGYLSYALWDKNEKYVVIVNREEKEIKIKIPIWIIEKTQGYAEKIFSNKPFTEEEKTDFFNGELIYTINEKTVTILKLN